MIIKYTHRTYGPAQAIIRDPVTGVMHDASPGELEGLRKLYESSLAQAFMQTEDDGVALRSTAHPPGPYYPWYQRLWNRVYWWWHSPKLSEDSLEDIEIEIKDKE